MKITKQAVAAKIGAFLRQEITTEDLVDWAEGAVREGEFQSAGVARIVARLGVADVRAFGLGWEDCQGLLKQLGYAAQVEIVVA